MDEVWMLEDRRHSGIGTSLAFQAFIGIPRKIVLVSSIRHVNLTTECG